MLLKFLYQRKNCIDLKIQWTIEDKGKFFQNQSTKNFFINIIFYNIIITNLCKINCVIAQKVEKENLFAQVVL